MADTLNTPFTNCLYYNIIVVTDVVLKYFLKYSTTYIAKYLHGSDVLIHVAPSSLRFHRDKICITLLVALSGLHVPKLIEFCRHIQLL